MGNKTLFVEIFQMFAQYRNPFTFIYAQTYPLPLKSTIVGMLQNACNDWYGNRIGVKKWWNLNISIHGGFESIFWNYQSLIKGKAELSNETKFGKISTPTLVNVDQKKLPLYGEGIISQRTPVYQQELFNGHIFFFIKGDENLIDYIQKALENPKKVLSLGRSEDVVFIKNVICMEEPDIRRIKGDLRLTYPTYIKEKNFPIANKKYPAYSIPTQVIFKNNGKCVKTKAEITKKTVRDVDFESVIYTGYNYGLILKEGEEIDVEFYDTHIGKFRILDNWGWL